MDNRTIKGYKFMWDRENSMFESRGEVHYDDYHDETPEPKLWEAAELLERMLFSEGFAAEANYSEKGWVEVTIQNK
tara:strand:+ start:350 stop:577 length:228 start_codon:yes stop_codon:yes gene_type:complete